MTATGIIFDIKKFSIHDGPGIRTTVFLKGCPLNCAWCHNPEGINPLPEIQFWPNRCIACWDCIAECEHQALAKCDNHRQHNPNICQVCGHCAEICPAEATQQIGKKVTVAEVMAEIEKDTLLYDESGGGATFSGGEPLLQIEYLEGLLQACKAHDIHTVVDTSGYTSPERFERIRQWVDLFLYDIKLMDSDRHRRFTGVPNEPILSNLKYLAQHGEQIFARMPIIPGINDDAENIQKTGSFLASLNTIQKINILPYHRAAANKYERMGNQYTTQNIQPPSPEQMQKILYQLETFGLKVAIGG